MFLKQQRGDGEFWAGAQNGLRCTSTVWNSEREATSSQRLQELQVETRNGQQREIMRQPGTGFLNLLDSLDGTHPSGKESMAFVIATGWTFCLSCSSGPVRSINASLDPFFSVATGSVLLHLTAAFDRVDHNVPFSPLEHKRFSTRPV